MNIVFEEIVEPRGICIVARAIVNNRTLVSRITLSDFALRHDRDSYLNMCRRQLKREIKARARTELRNQQTYLDVVGYSQILNDIFPVQPLLSPPELVVYKKTFTSQKVNWKEEGF